MLVDLEGHGREELLDGVDLSRTVGWFTTMFPVALDVPRTADWGAVLKAVKEQLRAVPRPGHRLRGPALPGRAAGAARAPAPQVSFNYLGQFDRPADGGRAASRPARRAAARRATRRAPAPHLLDVVGRVEHGGAWS